MIAFDIPTLITMLSAFIATIYAIYKLIVHFKNPKMDEIIDQKVKEKCYEMKDNKNKLSDLDHHTKLELAKIESCLINHDNNIKRLEAEHKEYQNKIFKKIDDMHHEIIVIIRDQSKG